MIEIMRFGAAVAALAVVSGFPSLAAAQTQTDLIGTFTAAGGYTDNVQSVPDALDPEPDSFAEVRPGLTLNVDKPLSAHRLNLTVVGQKYNEHSEADSVSGLLEYVALFLLSPRTDVAFILNAGGGEQNNFNQVVRGTVGAQPPGPVRYVSGSALESLAYALDQRWQLTQDLSFVAFYPFEQEIEGMSVPQAKTFGVLNRLGVARETEKSMYAVDLRVDYSYSTAVENPDETMPDLQPEQQIFIDSLMGRWRWAFKEDWETELGVGAVHVTRADDLTSYLIEPAGSAALRYLTEEGEVELAYAHDAGVNIYVAQTFLTDSVTLRGRLPLVPEDRLAVGASGGYQHGRQFNAATGEIDNSVDVFQTDAFVVWRPDPDFEFTLRYSFFNQIGHAGEMEEGAPTTFLRDTVMFEVTGTVGSSTPRQQQQIPGRARVGGSRRDFIESPGGRARPGGPR